MSLIERLNGRRGVVLASASALSVCLAVGLWSATHPTLPTVAWAKKQVPAATALLTLHGQGFTTSVSGSLVAAPLRAAPAGQPAMTVEAPSRADADFHLAKGERPGTIGVSLPGARSSAARVEGGVAVYEGAYDGVDVLALPETDSLEIAYLVRTGDAPPELALRIPRGAGESLRQEPATGATLLVGKDGRTRLRVDAPVAVDSAGTVRSGSYSISGDNLVIAMRLEGLKRPIVIDPRLTFPLWTILGDGRGPGAAVYDAASMSRETHLANDTARGRVVAVRPIRSQQFEDTTFIFGDASRQAHEQDVQRVDETLRTPTGTGAMPGAREADEWRRGFATESETWEWSGSSWSIASGAHLPGVIDPALAFDAARGRVVLYGGAAPGLRCDTNQISFMTCANNEALDVTYEYDGSAWSGRKIPGSPPPRLRASMAFDPASGRTILFGGREVETRNDQVHSEASNAPFPDNLTRGLLNDTWAYDGTTWQRIAAGSPPPAREGAQLVVDAKRRVLVLVGGRTATERAEATDGLTVWEFDGTDWVERVQPTDPSLAPSLRTRRGMTAFWNPVRQRVVIASGFSGRLDTCSLSDAEIAQRNATIGQNAAARADFAVTGCLGGFAHDAWEWDGRAFTKTADVAFAQMVGTQPLFRQVVGGASWAAGGAALDADAGAAQGGGATTALLPWRYDPRPDHFHLRTTLERAHAPATAPASGPPPVVTTAPATSGSPPVFASPVFASRIHGDATFDAARGVAQIFTPDDGGVYELDGSTWTDRTPRTSPFASGANDFFASAWDAQNQRIVLFDPRNGATWLDDDRGGWTRASPTRSPPAWGVDASLRRARDAGPHYDGTVRRDVGTAEGLAEVLLRVPAMTVDRARGHVVMLYEGATWQFDGQTWSSAALPPTWSACVAAKQIAFDGARGKVVAFGCTLPAQTWELDGVTWTGPGPGPNVGLVTRAANTDPARNPFDQRVRWQGSLQLAFAHASSAFESPALGGVSTIDGDGQLRTWTGTAWLPGPRMPEGATCLFSSSGGQGTTLEAAPLCAFPPAVEDAPHKRIIAFRDGPRGAQKVALDGVASAARAWTPLEIGQGSLSPSLVTAQVNPYPFELMAPEHLALVSQSDPATRVPNAPLQANFIQEAAVSNLMWAYRLLSDPGSGRIRVLTHRGMIWELGGESLPGPGEACKSDADCGMGGCSRDEGVCCDNPFCSGEVCMSCKGTTPGVCAPVPAGLPDPVGAGGCGAGECGGTCPGTATHVPRGSSGASVCRFEPTRACGPGPSCAAGKLNAGGHCAPRDATCIPGTAALPTCPIVNGVPQLSSACVLPSTSCPPGLGCASATTCKTTCATRADCASKYETCAPGGGGCVADVASKAATAAGVTPVAWTPPRMRSDEETAAILTDAGLASNDAGQIIIPTPALEGVALAFDPHRRSPDTGLRKCVNYLTTCMAMNKTIDSCVASASRCASTTPWLGDPAGDGCCPEACLVGYFQSRASVDPVTALDRIVTSGCYTAAAADGGAR